MNSQTDDTKTPKRVAIAFRGIGDIGGTNNTIAEHARTLSAQGFAVDLLGEKMNKGGVTADMGNAVRIPRLHALRRYKWRWFAWQAQRRLAAGSYDFVAGHGHHYTQNVLSMHNCLHRTHEIMHGTTLDPAGNLAEIHDRIFAQQTFDLCITNSQLMSDDLVSRYDVDARRMRVVYPGYRPQQFNLEDREYYRQPVRAELGVDEAIVIGMVTSGDFAKRGLDIVLEAFSGLPAQQQRRCMLLVIGKQGGAGPFEKQAQSLGIADRVRFVGTTRQPERYFHALDICVHPARFEEFGQSVQEAMACGVPLVLSRRVGASELLPADMHHDLPAIPDATNIRAQLAALIDAPERRFHMAQRARKAILGNTVEANFRQTLEIYRQAGL